MATPDATRNSQLRRSMFTNSRVRFERKSDATGKDNDNGGAKIRTGQKALAKPLKERCRLRQADLPHPTTSYKEPVFSLT